MPTIGLVRVRNRTGWSSSTQSHTYSYPSSTSRSGVSQVSVRPGPSQPRGFFPAKLRIAVADELPTTLQRGAGDRLVAPNRRAVDGEHGANPMLVQNLE